MKEDLPSARTVSRYLLCQLPGVLVAALVLFALWKWGGFPAWLSSALFALWVFKDAALFPFVWRAYVPDLPPSPMIGKVGEARDRLEPAGYVRIGEEFWRAELLPGSPPLDPGERVCVRGQKGLTLVVEKALPPPRGE